MPNQRLDLIAVGRVSLDLFARDIGAPFTAITGFESGVGGSPTNIAIAAARLGLQAVLLTAVGDDETGKFVCRYLTDQGVETAYIPTVSGKRTGMAVVGVQPPDRFPLVFYREDPADIHLTIDHAAALPLDATKALMLTGNGVSRGACREAVLFAAERARRESVTTLLDLDLRPDQWRHPLAYGLNQRTLLPHIDVVVGTEEEFYAALAPDPGAVMRSEAIAGAQRSELATLVRNMTERADGPHVAIVKRGAAGATLYRADAAPIDVPGFPAEILNTVGAGDAFAGGLLYGFAQGWEWPRCVRMGNACGALVVTRHGCSTAMPTLDEALTFITKQGGF